MRMNSTRCDAMRCDVDNENERTGMSDACVYIYFFHFFFFWNSCSWFDVSVKMATCDGQEQGNNARWL